uniref:N-6 DNA methylase n=1 Tax=Methanobrevibacter smithii TaxID=2173 RepID=UPI0037DDC69F
MKKFFQKLSNMISENYEPIFHPEFRHLYKTQYTQYDDIYLLSFGFLKLIDSALKFSKNDIINEYKQSKDDEDIANKLFNKAKYPDGELLGFYNYSNYDLEKLSENKTNVYNNFNEYINSFDENTQKVFENYEFNTVIDFLHANDLLFDLLKNLNNLDLKEYKTRNFKNMKSSYESFLNEFYIWEDLRNEAPSSINAENFLPYSLIKILLEDVNLKKKKQIKIFDPFCRDGFLLFETKRLIQEINPKCNVEIFGKEKDISQYAICLSKMIIDKEKPSNILKVYDLKSELLELDESNKFDLIISNFGIKDITLSYEERYDIFNTDPLEYFIEKLNNSGKLVSTISFDTLTKNHNAIFEMIYNDNLELITRIDMSGTDSDLVILSINKNKHKKRKNRFLLIDGNEVIPEIHNVHCINMTEPLLDKICNYYVKFKENKNIHLIHNSSFITKEYKDMVNKSFEKAASMTKDMNIFDSPFNETISGIVDEIEDYYFENCKVQFNFNRLIRGEKDDFESDGTPIYYLGELVDLVNDPDPSTNEELAEIFLIPLNKNDHDFENPFFYQSELRGYNQHNMIPFKINSDKISKEFLLYYLNSNKGKLELKESS